ncbi:hypothetical protein [Poritiphilus flavus]|uniref:Uncharacterized protein n=1 Tax=Poritiphilus flavus TaxID=2697053 RepID=A0A6L9EB09_9FLAO|nr:hypothetical protein [Poritiphilus flavus]NAS11843.1 hypothetical protein [Poritiphilus flavus]
MEENKEKILDQFIEKTVKEAGLDSPSMDFTSVVLSKLESQKSTITAYKPLISSRTWAILIAILSATGIWVLFGKAEFEFRWLKGLGLDTSAISTYMDRPVNIELPDIAMYAIVIMALFALLQAILLKARWDKRFLPG